MKVIHLEDAEKYEPEKGWLRAAICNEKGISLEYFVKPPNHSSPMHDHIHEQVCVVIKGKMKARNSAGNESILESDEGYALSFDFQNSLNAIFSYRSAPVFHESTVPFQ